MNNDRMRLITDFEDVVSRYESEPRPGGLKVVDSLSHITFRSEDERRQTLIVVFHLEKTCSLSRRMDEFMLTVIPFPFHIFLVTVSVSLGLLALHI